MDKGKEGGRGKRKGAKKKKRGKEGQRDQKWEGIGNGSEERKGGRKKYKLYISAFSL
jgi:hypothetical protein